MKVYRDLEIKKCPNPYNHEEIHIDMSKVVIGTNTFLGMIASYCNDHKGTMSFSDFFNKIIEGDKFVIIENIRDCASISNPGCLLLFGADCIRDLPDRWGLVIKECI